MERKLSMQVHKSVALILQILIIIVISAVVLGAGWMLLNLDIDTSEAEQKAQLSRLQASAQLYHSRLQYFEGVCSDIGVPSNWRCNSNTTAYAIEFDLGMGRFYCLDSGGFLGETRVSKGVSVACRNY